MTGLISVAALAAGGPAQAGVAARMRAVAAAAPGGTWGSAKELPGIAALNKDGQAELVSMSCASAGNCSAGGFYAGPSGQGKSYVFVVTEKGGRWGLAEQVPGSAALNQGKYTRLDSVSCGAAGNCSAAGYYTDASGHYQAFVVNETDGTWHKAHELPGSAALNQDGYGGLDSVSCASAGNCSAGGFYTDGSRHQQAFVVNETNGTWHKAQKVPGSAALNQDGYGGLDSVSCASAGNCSASGYYTDGSGHYQAFVVGETHSSWGTAQEVPGTAALNKGGFAGISSLSCTSVGNCRAGGSYTDGSRHEQAFVVDETHGSWGTADEVPGTGALNKGGSAGISSLSCTSVGNCSAGGSYTDGSGHQQVFVVNETDGSWGPAEEVPGSAALNQGGYAALDSVSCGAAGNCSAGGLYEDASGDYQAFIVSETNGSWGPAGEVAGTAALNQGGAAAVSPVSCAAAGQCSAGGSYKPHIGDSSVQAFVVSETASPGAGSRRSTGQG